MGSGIKQIAGLKQSKRAVLEGTTGSVYVAHDADCDVVKEFVDICRSKSIDINFEYNKQALASLAKVDVPTSVLMFTD